MKRNTEKFLNYLDGFIVFGLLALIFAVPLCTRPFFFSYGFQEKFIPYSQVFVAGLVVLSLVYLALTRKFNLTVQPLSLPVISYIILVVLSVFFSTNPGHSRENLPQTASYAGLFYLALVHLREEKRARMLISVLLCSGLVACMAGFYQYFFGFKQMAAALKTSPDAVAITGSYTDEIQRVIQMKRVFGTFLQPNSFAGFILMLLPLSLTLITRRKLPAIILAGVFLISMALTRSVGSWLVLCVMLVISAYTLTVKAFTRKAFVVSLITVLIILAGLMILRPGSVIDTGSPENSLFSRLCYWKTAVRIIEFFPWLGAGPGTFGSIYASIRDKGAPYASYVHNHLLQTGAESGLPAVLAFLWMAGVLLRSGWNYLRNKEASNEHKMLVAGFFFSIMAFFLHSMIDYDASLWEMNVPWWIMCGTLASLLPGGLRRDSDAENACDRLTGIFSKYGLSFVFAFAALAGGLRQEWAAYVFCLLVLFLAFAAVLKWRKNRKLELVSTPLDAPVWILFAWICFSALFSLNYTASLKELYICAAMIVLFHLVTLEVKKKNGLDPVFFVIAGGGLFFSILALVDFISARQVNAWLPNPNLLAGYLVASLLVILNCIFYREGKSPFRFYFVLAFIFLVFLLTMSRGGVISLLAGLAVTFCGYYFSRSETGLRKKILAAGFLSGCIILVVLAGFFAWKTRNDPLAYHRILIWKSTLRMISAKPLIGTGPGTYVDVFRKYNFPLEGGIARFGRFAEFSHNEYLQTAAESGLPALLLVFCLVAIYIGVLRQRQISKENFWQFWSSAGIIAGVLTQALVDFNVRLPVIFLFLTLSAVGAASAKTAKIKVINYTLRYWSYAVITIALLGVIVVENLVGLYYFNRAMKMREFNTRRVETFSCFSKAILFDPFNAKYHDAMAGLCQELSGVSGKFSDFAEQHYRQATRLNRANAYFHRHLSNFFLRNGKTDDAISEKEKALSIDPLNPFLCFELAGIYYCNKADCLKAEKYLDRAIELEPNYAWAHFLRAMVRKKENRAEESKQDFQQVSEIVGKYSKTAATDYEKALVNFPVRLVMDKLKQ